LSIEGGMSGTQQRFVCASCGKIFFAWRPDTAPGQKIKCYFCKKEMEDDAAKRVAPPAPEAPATAPAPAPAESEPPAV
jgi:DNA-directed RNA polymerase subunit RPC12/RpoP